MPASRNGIGGVGGQRDREGGEVGYARRKDSDQEVNKSEAVI